MRELWGSHERNPCVEARWLRHQGASLRRGPPTRTEAGHGHAGLERRTPGARRRSQPERRRAAAASAWCCWSRSRWSAPRSACCWSAAATPGPISWRCWRSSPWSACSRCLRWRPASCASPARTPATRCSRRVVDEAVDGLLVTDPRGRVIYANAAYLDLVDATDAERRAAGRAGVHRRPRRLGGGLSPAQGGARGPPRPGGGARRRAQGQGGALAAAARPAARRSASGEHS